MFLFLPSLSRADTHAAADCEYTSVAAAVSAASSGDTVTVPAGTCTWNTELAITKGLILQGAGPGSTNITSSATYTWSYIPASPSLNEAFQVTGFTFNLNGAAAPFHLRNTPNSANKLDSIRINNNVWTGASISHIGTIRGQVYGVFDNNTVSGTWVIYHQGDVTGDGYSWDNYFYDFGSRYAWYVENNTFNLGNDDDWYVTYSAGGARWVYRFNTFTLFRSHQPLLDAHGNQGTNPGANMAAEIYNNTVNEGGSDHFFSLRGGKAMVFGNTFSGGYSPFMNVREEYADSIGPGAAAASDGTTQHAGNSYYWENRKNGGTLFGAAESTDCCGVIAENAQFWNQTESFNGTVGVGVGTLAARPATCTTGVGYWATDQGSWNAAGEDGVLYKCTATDTWTSYYTPYTYPHPLAAGWDTTPTAFSFTDNTDVDPSTVIYSDSITVFGIDNVTSITSSGTGCSYQVNGAGDWLTTGGDNVSLSDTIQMKTTSLASASTPQQTSCTLVLDGSVSDTWYVTTIAVPNIPTLVSPTEDETGVARPVTFSWSTVTGAELYQIQIATDSAFTDIVIDVQTVNTTYEATTLLPGMRYYWRVRALQ